MSTTKRIFCSLSVIMFALSSAALLAASSWTHVGTAGFTKLSPNQLTDRKRPAINSMIKDSAGNIWVSCSYDDSEFVPGQGFYHKGSGVTVFKAGGGTVSVDVNALGYKSCITKLVEGGDGAVYALLNFSNLEWTTYAQFQDYILRLELKPNDTIQVTEIYTPGSQGPIWTAPVVNKIGGMAVGEDGNIYWTQNGVNSYWKYHFFWRYNVALGQVEEAPNRDGLVQECGSETHRLLDLEHVGNNQFAIVGPYYNAKWQCTPISWTTPAVFSNDNTSDPTWGRKWNTASAYDPLRKKMWVGGRGEITYREWRLAGSAGTIVDLGNGNKGISMSTTGATNEYYTDQFGIPSARETGALRFRVDNYNTDFILMWLYGNARYTTTGNGVAVALQVIGGRFKLMDLYPDAGNPAELADLGPVNLGQWNELYVYIDAGASLCKATWNGTVVYNGSIGHREGKNWLSWFEWGSRVGAAGSGVSAVTFDWVAQCLGDAGPGEVQSKYWLYLDGSILPTADPYFLGSNIMTRFDGDPLNPTIFNSNGKVGTFNSYPVWHANSYDELFSPTPGKRLHGMYWISALAVNPYTGEAWVSWGAESTYEYDEVGRVRTVPVNITSTKPPLGDEGVPETGAQVVALMFDGGTAYALTCNLTTGAYNVYAKSLDIPGPMSIAAAKSMPVGVMVTTDSAKLVTLSNPDDRWFYVEDDDRTSGIKVIPQLDQPIGSVGQRAQITGFTAVVDGEAVIYATSVQLSTTEDKIEPLAMSIRNVGGGQLGAQPPTYAGDSSNSTLPATLNTTGLLIRVVGRLVVDWNTFKEYIDDGSGYPLYINWPSGVGASENSVVAITGVSTVQWDSTAKKGFRSITPRDSADIDIFSIPQ
jgi:hypothetical protein